MFVDIYVSSDWDYKEYQEVAGVKQREGEKTATEAPQRDIYLGLNAYMYRVSTTATLGLLGTLGIGTGCALVLPAAAMGSISLVGCLSSFGCVLYLQYLRSKVMVEETKDGLRSIQPQARIATFGGLVTSMGVSMSPFMEKMIEIDPTIPPIALGITAGTLSATYLYTHYRPITRKVFDTLEIAMFTGLMGSLSLGVTALCIYPFYPQVGEALSQAHTYLGIPLYAFMSAYTFAAARRSYIEGKPDYIGEACQLYLDALNLIIRIMKVLADQKTKK